MAAIAGCRTLNCAGSSGITAFAQLTWASLRDIEVCLSAQANKLYHMGLREAVARSTPGRCQRARDWRIWHELAQFLIRRARRLYAAEASPSIWTTRSTRWTRRRSTCACRCFRMPTASTRRPPTATPG
ncbi:MAG: DUF4372 domain-containing protein [Betaproteobacteria bacterium]|nr:DUF4372 domain-containing protein [Betaproteobacteria bacterium]